MVGFRTEEVTEYDLVSDLHQGDVFYDEGGVYVRSQTLNGHPRIVTEMGLICSLGEIEYTFKMNGACPEVGALSGSVGA